MHRRQRCIGESNYRRRERIRALLRLYVGVRWLFWVLVAGRLSTAVAGVRFSSDHDGIYAEGTRRIQTGRKIVAAVGLCELPASIMSMAAGGVHLGIHCISYIRKHYQVLISYQI